MFYCEVLFKAWTKFVTYFINFALKELNELNPRAFLASTRPVLVFSLPTTHSEQILNENLRKLKW